MSEGSQRQPPASRKKSHLKKKRHTRAAAGLENPTSEELIANVAAVVPRHNIEEIPALANALEFFIDANIDRILAKNFLMKCLASMNANDIKLSVTLPKNATTPGPCYISHPPTTDVSVWENNQIIHEKMSLADAETAKIPPCVPPRRR